MAVTSQRAPPFTLPLENLGWGGKYMPVHPHFRSYSISGVAPSRARPPAWLRISPSTFRCWDSRTKEGKWISASCGSAVVACHVPVLLTLMSNIPGGSQVLSLHTLCPVLNAIIPSLPSKLILFWKWSQAVTPSPRESLAHSKLPYILCTHSLDYRKDHILLYFCVVFVSVPPY